MQIIVGKIIEYFVIVLLRPNLPNLTVRPSTIVRNVDVRQSLIGRSLEKRLYRLANTQASNPSNTLQTIKPPKKPSGVSIQTVRVMSMCTMCPVVVIIGPGIVQTSNEQISQAMAVVIDVANARLNALSFIITTSIIPCAPPFVGFA
ncbi:MAG TPA: hypothetical protein VFZ23_10955 [Pyrinomonadaceae bacterium]